MVVLIGGVVVVVVEVVVVAVLIVVVVVVLSVGLDRVIQHFLYESHSLCRFIISGVCSGEGRARASGGHHPCRG